MDGRAYLALATPVSGRPGAGGRLGDPVQAGVCVPGAGPTREPRERNNEELIYPAGPFQCLGSSHTFSEGADVFQGTKQLVIKSFCSSFSGDSSDLYPLLTVNALSSPLPLGPSLEPWASAVAHQPHNFSIPMASASPHLCLLKAGYYPLSLHFFFFHFGPPQQ